MQKFNQFKNWMNQIGIPIALMFCAITTLIGSVFPFILINEAGNPHTTTILLIDLVGIVTLALMNLATANSEKFKYLPQWSPIIGIVLLILEILTALLYLGYKTLSMTAPTSVGCVIAAMVTLFLLGLAATGLRKA